MFRGLSLANKCQLLFGAAIILIIAAALLAPWFRMGAIIDLGQIENSRQIARLWLNTGAATRAIEAAASERARPQQDQAVPRDGEAESLVTIRWVGVLDLREAVDDSSFEGAAARRFTTPPQNGGDPAGEYFEAVWDGSERLYRYARAVRAGPSDPLQGFVVVDRRSPRAGGQLLTNRIYLLAAGVVAGTVAVLVFYLITTRIILSPVRDLRRTAERVREGDLSVRSGIRTGDEFEELSEAFNAMLAALDEQQERLRSVNRTLDLRLTEMAEANVALFEANKVKGEFLATISHELRTPLNSIIGFAELLQAIAGDDESRADLSDDDRVKLQRRARYLDNIVTAGRSLLEMINELLDMARLEAGRIDLHVEPMNVGETCDGLLALIRPQAERKGLDLRLELPPPPPAHAHPEAPPSLPIIETDPRKFQRVVFNFLSNAVKFTPEGGRVTLRAERLDGGPDGETRVRVSVLDSGPGISAEDQKRIFEKFRQLDSGHTREHQGTGLGLAIAREFAGAIGAEILVESAPGQGSMFSLIAPRTFDRSLIERVAQRAEAASQRLIAQPDRQR